MRRWTISGNVVDHTSVQARCTAAVLQGVGQVLGEHAIYDSETGNCSRAASWNYPNAARRLDARHTLRRAPGPTKANTLGAKGVGESGTSGALGRDHERDPRRRAVRGNHRISTCR